MDLIKEIKEIKKNLSKLEKFAKEEKKVKQPKKPLLTEDEKAILRNLPKQYKWIARDKDCSLNIYDEKPDEKYAFHWNFVSDIVELCPFEHLFQFIKWEDEEPYKIQELLEEYENLRSE